MINPDLASILKDRDVVTKLHRMQQLNAIIKAKGDNTPEFIFDEYRKLVGPMAEYCTNLVEGLIDAGLLTIQIDSKALAEMRQWAHDVSPITGKLDSIDFEPEWCEPNGNLWIWVGAVTGASGADQHIKKN